MVESNLSAIEAYSTRKVRFPTNPSSQHHPDSMSNRPPLKGCPEQAGGRRICGGRGDPAVAAVLRSRFRPGVLHRAPAAPRITHGGGHAHAGAGGDHDRLHWLLVAGFAGASIAALATFLPCYLLTIIPAPYFKKCGKRPEIAAFVEDVTTAAIGAITGAVAAHSPGKRRDCRLRDQGIMKPVTTAADPAGPSSASLELARSRPPGYR